MEQDTLSLLIQQGIQIGTQIQQSNTLVPNVDNGLIGSVLTILASLIVRVIEKRKLRKQDKLKDKVDANTKELA